MTCREKLLIEHPDMVKSIYWGGCNGCPDDYGYLPTRSDCNSSDGTCRACWDREIPGTEPIKPTEPTEPTEPKEDVVNHPNHYTNGNMECIEEMILIFGKKATMTFCLLNAWKYRRRAIYKNGEEDMKKSHWYINKYKELKEEVDGEGM